MELAGAVWFGTRRSVVRIHSPRPTFSIASLDLRQQRGQTPITNPAGRETVPDPQRPAECASTRRDGRSLMRGLAASMRYTCEQIVEALLGYFDGDLPEEASVAMRDHLRGCGTIQQL